MSLESLIARKAVLRGELRKTEAAAAQAEQNRLTAREAYIEADEALSHEIAAQVNKLDPDVPPSS